MTKKKKNKRRHSLGRGSGDLGLQSFLKVKVTLTLRDVILCHDNKHLLSFFDLGLSLID